MAKQHSGRTATVEVGRPSTIVDRLAEVHDAISRRAYELFQSDNDTPAGPWSDWFTAERELVWTPAVELREKEGLYELEVAVPGVDPANLEVQATPDDILIEGATEHRQDSKNGSVQVSEFSCGRLFRSVHLPEPIDPTSVKAEVTNGMLRLTAAVARKASKVVVQAA